MGSKGRKIADSTAAAIEPQPPQRRHVSAYSPDTNFFFQCRQVAELPWHELEGADPSDVSEVRLSITPAVMKEIDRHKGKGNSRTARRAREASSLFRRAFGSANNQVELRPSLLAAVVLELPPLLKIDFSDFQQSAQTD
jgi:hypothetical protein